MAIVHCPGCSKRFSSVQGVCPNCGAEPGQAKKQRKLRHSGAGPAIHNLIAMLVAVGGAGWYYSAMATGSDPSYAKWMIGIGLVWYVASRIWAAVRR